MTRRGILGLLLAAPAISTSGTSIPTEASVAGPIVSNGPDPSHALRRRMERNLNGPTYFYVDPDAKEFSHIKSWSQSFKVSLLKKRAIEKDEIRLAIEEIAYGDAFDKVSALKRLAEKHDLL